MIQFFKTASGPTAAILLTAVSLGATLPAAFAAGPTPLKGTMFITGRTAIDPPPNEPKDTHAGFTIEGPAAMRMFKAMKSRAKPDTCLGDGWVSKFAGPMFCSLAPKGSKATCYVTISLVDGSTSTSRQGC